MNKIEQLKKLNFEKVGKWFLENNEPNYLINNDKKEYESERVIYAFTNEEKPLYIGICEANTTTLKNRLYKYKKKQGRSTNERILNEIGKELIRGHKIYIYALKPEIIYYYDSLEIDTVRGLEYPLIRKFNPEWNKMGK